MASKREDPQPEKVALPVDDNHEIEEVENGLKHDLPWEDLKHILLLAITSLQNKVERFRAFSNQVVAERDKLQKELDKRKEDEADIHAYLERELAKTQAEFRILDHRALELAKENEDLRFNFQKDMMLERAHYDAVIADLKNQIATYETELHDLAKYRASKAELERELTAARQQLQKLEKEYSQKLRDVERHGELERDKLLNQMYTRIKQTKEHFLKMTDDQIDTITKRTIMENEQKSAELAYQSKQTKKLLLDNDRLKQDNSIFKRDIDLLKQQEAELAKKNTVYQKTIKTLLNKIKVLDSDQRELKGTVQAERDAHILALEEFIKSLELKIATLEQHLSEANSELEVNRRELGQYAKEMQRMMALQDEAEHIILSSFDINPAANPTKAAQLLAYRIPKSGSHSSLPDKDRDKDTEEQSARHNNGDATALLPGGHALDESAASLESTGHSNGSPSNSNTNLPDVPSATSPHSKTTPRAAPKTGKSRPAPVKSASGGSGGNGSVSPKDAAVITTSFPVRVSRAPGGGGRMFPTDLKARTSVPLHV